MLLCRSAARSDKRIMPAAAVEPANNEDIEVTREESGKPEMRGDAERGDECMHIIFSGNGVYKRTTYDSSPSLMFAWPKIVLDYR